MSPTRLVLICIFALVLSMPYSTAFATNNKSEVSLIGVWRGSIGKRQIMVCWEALGISSLTGDYYDIRKPIRKSLTRESSGLWIENEEDETESRWEIETIGDDRVTGIWRKNEGDRGVPIQLTRVRIGTKRSLDKLRCNFSDAMGRVFNAPRVSAQKISSGVPSAFMGKPYRTISALRGSVASIELLGDDESLAKANKMFRDELYQDIFQGITCDDFVPPKQGSYSTYVRLRMWGDEWLSWSSHVEGYCGGAHPFFGSATRTMNLRTGKEVDLWSWFKLVRNRKSEDHRQICSGIVEPCLPTRLGKHIFSLRPAVDDPSCKQFDFHESTDSYSIGLSDRGIVFIPTLVEPARAMRACYANFTVPFADLDPYLSGVGKEAVNMLIGSNSGPRDAGKGRAEE